MSDTIQTTKTGRFLSWWSAVQKERRRAKVQRLVYAALGTDHDQAEAMMRHLVGLWDRGNTYEAKGREEMLKALDRSGRRP